MNKFERISPVNSGEDEVTEKGRGRGNLARKVLLNALMAAGMAGFWMDSSKTEAQDATTIHQSMEQKEVARPDFFRMNELAKDYAAFRLAKLPTPPNEPYTMADDLKKREKVRVLYEDMAEKYGGGAVSLMDNRTEEKMIADGAKPGTPTREGLMANFLDDEKLLEDVVFDENLPQQMLSHKKGYLIKQIELDGKNVDVLIEYVYEPSGPTVDSEMAEKKMQTEMDEVDKTASDDPASKGRFVWGNKIQLAPFTIKGSNQHPGYYKIFAVSEKERDSRAPVF